MRFDGDSREKGVTCRSLSCLPPWFILWRWFNGGETRDSRRGFMKRKLGNVKIKVSSGVKSGKIKRGSRNCEASSSSSREVNVPETGKDASFNLGVGFGLIYFVRDELNRMVELRQSIETLLRDLRAELRNEDKKPLPTPSKTSISSSFSNNGVQEISYSDENNCNQQLSSHDAEGPTTYFSSGRYRRDKSLRMDQLEAELEAEFDRLQITSADSFKYSRVQQYSEDNVDGTAPDLSLNACHEEEDGHGPHDEHYCISPRELERRLHEVLETRQQERIDELESALEYAMQQLEERERELTSWQDAARFVSRHFPANIAVSSRQGKQDVYCVEPELEAVERGKSLVKSSICGARAI